MSKPEPKTDYDAILDALRELTVQIGKLKKEVK